MEPIRGLFFHLLLSMPSLVAWPRDNCAVFMNESITKLLFGMMPPIYNHSFLEKEKIRYANLKATGFSIHVSGF